MAGDRTRKRNSLIATVIIQIILFLGLFFIVAWRETFPPVPEYGFEISFDSFQSSNSKKANNEDKEILDADKVEEEMERDSEVLSDSSSNESTNKTEAEEIAEEVIIDERSLYGKTDAGKGASLQMSGWVWDSEPQPEDTSDETGKVVFSITIDDEGYITSITTLSSTLSPTVEQYYRLSIEQLTFSKTSSYQPAPVSRGTITFILRNRE